MHPNTKFHSACTMIVVLAIIVITITSCATLHSCVVVMHLKTRCERTWWSVLWFWLTMIKWGCTIWIISTNTNKSYCVNLFYTREKAAKDRQLIDYLETCYSLWTACYSHCCLSDASLPALLYLFFCISIFFLSREHFVVFKSCWRETFVLHVLILSSVPLLHILECSFAAMATFLETDQICCFQTFPFSIHAEQILHIAEVCHPQEEQPDWWRHVSRKMENYVCMSAPRSLDGLYMSVVWMRIIFSVCQVCVCVFRTM